MLDAYGLQNAYMLMGSVKWTRPVVRAFTVRRDLELVHGTSLASPKLHDAEKVQTAHDDNRRFDLNLKRQARYGDATRVKQLGCADQVARMVDPWLPSCPPYRRLCRVQHGLD
jgi:hypothetical protein